MNRRVLGILFVTCAALAACNALTGLSDDFSVRADGGGGGGLDGSGDARSVLDADVALDGSVNDDGDVIAPAEAGPSFCDQHTGSQVAFCTDFEAPATGPVYGWDQEEHYGGVVDVVDGVGRGGTRGLRATVQNFADSRHATLWKNVIGTSPLAFSHYELTFDYEIVQQNVFYGAIAVLSFEPAGGGDNYFGAASYNGTVDNSGLGGGPVAPVNADPRGTWHTAVVAVVRADAGMYSASLVVDGVTLSDANPLNLANGSRADVLLGFFFTSSGSGIAEVHFDNVVVRRY